MEARVKNKGYLTFEILIVCALLCIFCTMLVNTGSNYMHYYQRHQVQIAADMLAGDIRLLQQQSLFADGILNRQIKFTRNDGYAFYVNQKIIKKRYFADFGCQNVYIAKKMPMIQYTNNGSPSVNGSIILKHKLLPEYSCIVSVQPVTGRVVIDETK